MKQITELQKRSSLKEGRNFGYGFTILKSKNENDDVFETVLPFTACKDYLNDLIYVENTKENLDQVHGYKHELINLFDNQKYFYIGVNALHYISGSIHPSKETIENTLIKNFKNIEKIINIFEEKLQLETRTFIILDEDTLILKVPIYWSKTTPLISMYTLLIRYYGNMFVELEDFSIEKFNNNFKNHSPILVEDKYYKNYIEEFYKLIPNIELLNIQYNEILDIKHPRNIHNFGIVGYLAHLKKLQCKEKDIIKVN